MQKVPIILTISKMECIILFYFVNIHFFQVEPLAHHLSPLCKVHNWTNSIDNLHEKQDNFKYVLEIHIFIQCYWMQKNKKIKNCINKTKNLIGKKIKANFLHYNSMQQ